MGPAIQVGTRERHLFFSVTLAVLDLSFATAIVCAILRPSWRAALQAPAIVLAAAAVALLLLFVESRFALSGLPAPSPRLVLAMVVVSAIVVAVCLPTTRLYFYNDDFSNISFFNNLRFDQFLHLFRADISKEIWGESSQELRPLTGVLWVLSYRIWGVNAGGYHWLCLVLHLLSSLAVARIAASVGRSNWTGLIAGSLFAVLPLHSEEVCWISESISGGAATFLYLLAFASFLHYRDTLKPRFAVLTAAIFAISLFVKEIVVTLPLMLVAFELLRVRRAGPLPTPGTTLKLRWTTTLLPYVPLAVLLLLYLVLRHFAFGNYLREQEFSGTSILRSRSFPDFLEYVRALPTGLWRFLRFSVREVLVPGPAVAVVFELGLYCFLILSLALQRGRATVRPILFFALTWYLIASTPLLVSGLGSRYLYLSAVGPCVAFGLLLIPADGFSIQQARLRLPLAFVLVLVLGVQFVKKNEWWIDHEEIPTQTLAQFEAAVKTLPNDALVVFWSPVLMSPPRSWTHAMPFLLRPPFSSVDLSSHARFLENTDMYCCTVRVWWNEMKPLLLRELQGPPDQPVDVHLLTWREHESGFLIERRGVSKAAMRNSITGVLGDAIENVTMVDEVKANELVEAIARLVLTRESPRARDDAPGMLFAARTVANNFDMMSFSPL